MGRPAAARPLSREERPDKVVQVWQGCRPSDQDQAQPCLPEEAEADGGGDGSSQEAILQPLSVALSCPCTPSGSPHGAGNSHTGAIC